MAVEPVLNAVQMQPGLEEAYLVLPVRRRGPIGESEPIERRKDELRRIVRLDDPVSREERPVQPDRLARERDVHAHPRALRWWWKSDVEDPFGVVGRRVLTQYEAHFGVLGCVGVEQRCRMGGGLGGSVGGVSSKTLARVLTAAHETLFSVRRTESARAFWYKTRQNRLEWPPETLT